VRTRHDQQQQLGCTCADGPQRTPIFAPTRSTLETLLLVLRKRPTSTCCSTPRLRAKFQTRSSINAVGPTARSKWIACSDASNRHMGAALLTGILLFLHLGWIIASADSSGAFWSPTVCIAHNAGYKNIKHNLTMDTVIDIFIARLLVDSFRCRGQH
jgi:hypothetical protein